MAVRDYEAIFVGGGLAAMLLLRELGAALSGRVAVVDPCPPPERPTVHWSHVPTLYDRFAVGSWRKARVAQMPAEPVAPYTLRLVRHAEQPQAGDGRSRLRGPDVGLRELRAAASPRQRKYYLGAPLI